MSKKMLFLIYFEMDSSKDPSELLNAFQKIQEANIEPEKWEVKGWYVTPGYWGVAIVETDSVDNLLTNANSWRIALPGIFKVYKCSVAAEVEQYAPNLAKLVRKIKK